MQNSRLHSVGVPLVYSQLSKSTIITLIVSLLTFGAFAQTYTSNFTTPAGNFGSASPSGALCIAPTLANAANVADASTTNYAGLTGLLSVTLLCDNPVYSIRAKLNLPTGTAFLPAGSIAGFRVQMATLVSVSLLQSNMSIRTYLAGSLRETITGANILNISLLSNASPVNLQSATTLSFDEVELVFNSAIIPLNVILDYRFYNAYGTVSVLPVSFGEVTANIASGRLNVNWKTVSEKDNEKFIIQASANGKSWTDVGTVVSKSTNGNSSIALDYNFSTAWSNTVLAGFGLLGLLLLPAARNKWMKLAVLVLAVSAIASCAKDNDVLNDSENGSSGSGAVYVRVAQVDKDGTSTHSDAVVAKR